MRLRARISLWSVGAAGDKIFDRGDQKAFDLLLQGSNLRVHYTVDFKSTSLTTRTNRNRNEPNFTSCPGNGFTFLDLTFPISAEI